MIRLDLQREPTQAEATIGALYLNGVWQCWTLEDAVRERPGEPVSAWKVPGQTAIPSGTYQVLLTYSARFGRELPLVVNVPGFLGIRFHSGNVIGDTEGCILLGFTRGPGRIGGSRQALESVQGQLQGQAVTLHLHPAWPMI